MLAARRAFGRVDRSRTSIAIIAGVPASKRLLQDARFAVRLLRRDPSFTLRPWPYSAWASACNSMLFTIVNAHAIRGLPIRDARNVLYLTTADDRRPDLNVSLPDFNDWRAGATSFESLAAFTMEPSSCPAMAACQSVSLRRSSRARHFRSSARSQLWAGRSRSSTTSQARRRSSWLVRRCGRHATPRDTSVLGRAVTINGTPSVIVGVMPQRIGFPSTGDLWLPLAQHPLSQRQERQARSLVAIGRLAPGRDIGQARAEIETISARLAGEHPDTNNRVRATGDADQRGIRH